MITVRRLRPGEGELYRQMRLTSLRESPTSFCSTYESAVQRSPESWSEQADGTAHGSDRATFLAFAGAAPVGMAALYRTGDGSDVGELLQVWVAPEQRGGRAAFELMDAVFEWAGENGFGTVAAAVKNDNVRALRFYRAYGFVPSNDISLDRPTNSSVVSKGVEAAEAVSGPRSPRSEQR